MPGINVTIGGSAKPLEQAFLTADRAAQIWARRMDRNIALGLGQWAATGVAPNPLAKGLDEAAHSGFNLNGVLRETVVVFRELGRGNWSRIPGSLSLIAQHAGVLKYIISPLGAVIAGAAAIAFLAYRNFNRWAQETKNLSEVLHPLTRNLSEEADTIKRCAEATQQFTDWLHSLGAEHVSLADKVDRVIKRLQEESKLQQEIARGRGASPQSIQKMELAAAQAQLAIVERGKEAAYERLKIDREAAQLAQTQSNSKARADRITDVGKQSKEFAEIADAIQEKMMGGYYKELLERRSQEGGRASVGFDVFTGQTSYKSLDEMIRAMEGDLVHVTVNGKEFSMSLDAARKKFDELTTEESQLAETQRQLNDLLQQKKKFTEKDIQDIQNLTKKESDLISEMGLAGKYGPQLAALGGGRGGSGGVTERERIGAASNSIQMTQLDVIKQQLLVQKNTLDEVKKLSRGDGNGDGSVGGTFF